MSDFLKRYPLRVGCVLVALLSIAGLYFVGGKIEESTTLLAQKSAEGERLAANVRNAAQLPEQLALVTANGQKIQDRLIKASQLANNLQYFYRLESETGVELLDVRQTSGASAKGGNQGVGFAVSVRAEYPVLIAYLRTLENGPHFCRVLSASIGPGGSETGDRSGKSVLALNVELLGQP